MVSNDLLNGRRNVFAVCFGRLNSFGRMRHLFAARQAGPFVLLMAAMAWFSIAQTQPAHAQCAGVGTGTVTCTVIDDVGAPTANANLGNIVPPIVDSDFIQNDGVTIFLEAVATNAAGDATAGSTADDLFVVTDTTGGGVSVIQNGAFDITQSVSATATNGNALIDPFILTQVVLVTEADAGDLTLRNTGNFNIQHIIGASATTGNVLPTPTPFDPVIFEATEAGLGGISFQNTGNFTVDQRETLSATDGVVDTALDLNFNKVFDLTETDAGDITGRNTGNFTVNQHLDVVTNGTANNDALNLNVEQIDAFFWLKESGPGFIDFENDGNFDLHQSATISVTNGNVDPGPGQYDSVSVNEIDQIIDLEEFGAGDLDLVNRGNYNVSQRLTINVENGNVLGAVVDEVDTLIESDENDEGTLTAINHGDISVSQELSVTITDGSIVGGDPSSTTSAAVWIDEIDQLFEPEEDGPGDLITHNYGDIHASQRLMIDVTRGNVSTLGMNQIDQLFEADEDVNSSGSGNFIGSNHGDVSGSQVATVNITDGDLTSMLINEIDDLVEIREQEPGDMDFDNFGSIRGSQEATVTVANGNVQTINLNEVDNLLEIHEDGAGALFGSNAGDISGSQMLTVSTIGNGGNIGNVSLTQLDGFIDVEEDASQPGGGNLEFTNTGDISAYQSLVVSATDGSVGEAFINTLGPADFLGLDDPADLGDDINDLTGRFVSIREFGGGDFVADNFGNVSFSQILDVSTIGAAGGNIENAYIGETGGFIFASETEEGNLTFTNDGNSHHDQMIRAHATDGSVNVTAARSNNSIAVFEFDNGNLDFENSGRIFVRQLVEASATGGGDVNISGLTAQGKEAGERGDGNLTGHSSGAVTILQEIVASATGGGTINVGETTAIGVFLDERDIGDLDFHQTGDIRIVQTLSHGTGTAYGLVARETGDGTLTLTKRGAVLVQADTAIAIDLRVDVPGSTTTLNLLAGTPISGLMSASVGQDTLNLGLGESWDLTFTPDLGQADDVGPNQGLPETIDAFGAALFVDAANNRIITFDPNANVFGLESEALADLTGAINLAVRSRLNALGSTPTTGNVAAYGLNAISLGRRGDGNFWAQAIGSARDDGNDGNVYFGGFMTGVDIAHSNGVGGVFFGGATGSVDGTPTTRHEIDTDTWFAGGYLHTDLTGFAGMPAFADFIVSGGYQNNDSARGVVNNNLPGGVANYTGSYDGWFISAEGTVGAVLTPDFLPSGKTLTPYTRLGYAGLFQDGFTETGGAAAASFGDRDVHLLLGELAVDLTDHRPFGGGRLQSTVTGGLRVLGNVGDSTFTSSLLVVGDTLTSALDTDTELLGFVGSKIAFTADNNFRLLFAGELGFEGGGTTVATGSIGASFPF